jgi:hypothetical protein
MFAPWLRPLYWLYMKRMQLILTQIVPCCTLRKSSCCRRNVPSAGWCVIVYDVQHILLTPLIALSTTSTFMRHDSACFSQITMHRFKYTSVRLAAIRLSALIFPQRSGRISIAKTMHEMQISIFRISKYRHLCCCPCSCYWHYCPNLITALQLSVLPGILSAKPPSSDHNGKKRHQRKKSVTWERYRMGKILHLHFLLQMISPTTSLETVPELCITLYMLISILNCFYGYDCFVFVVVVVIVMSTLGMQRPGTPVTCACNVTQCHVSVLGVALLVLWPA